MSGIENISLQGPLARKGLAAFQDKRIKPHKPPHRWYIIADSEKALIYQRKGQEVERIGEASPHIPYKKLQGNEDIGRRMRQKTRIGNEATPNREGMSPSYQSEHHEEILFIKSLAAYLEDGLNNNAYEELVLIAAPRTLGELRKELPERVKDCVQEELNKDLTNVPHQTLKKQLEKIT